VDWRDVLRNFIERVANNDYSWEQPDRRFIHAGIFLPDLFTRELGEVVIVSDTSASRPPEDLRQDATEMSEILGLYDATIHVVYVDAEVQGFATYTREDLPLSLEFPGRGGTEFRPAFQWVQDNLDHPPSCLIYLTDMECHDFPEPPDYPVLWIQNGNYPNPPPFGELVKM